MNVRIGVLALACAALVTACGEETPSRAVYELAHALEHEDVDDACNRLFLATSVPEAVAQQLASRAHATAGAEGWDEQVSSCMRDLGRAGAYRRVSLDQPLVRSVRLVRVSPESGITEAAVARVTLDYGPAVDVRLVEFNEVWRVLVQPDGRIVGD